MTDNEEDARRAEQARALDVYKPTGAMIVHNHLHRHQDVISVTRDDLENILLFDGVSAFLYGFGTFMLSGSTWIIAENSLDVDGFGMTSLMSFCIASFIFGGVLLVIGAYFHFKKRSRISKLFEQTTPRIASTSSTGG